MASFSRFFVSPYILLLEDSLLLLSALFPVCQQHLFQSNPAVAVLPAVVEPQIQSPCGLKSLQSCFDAELHLGYMLLVDIPPLEMLC